MHTCIQLGLKMECQPNGYWAESKIMNLALVIYQCLCRLRKYNDYRIPCSVQHKASLSVEVILMQFISITSCTLWFMYGIGYPVSFLGLAQLECGTDHSPPSSTKVEERLKQHLYFSYAFMACYRVNHTLFLTYKQYFRNVMISLSLSLSKVKENVHKALLYQILYKNIMFIKPAYFSTV